MLTTAYMYSLTVLITVNNMIYIKKCANATSDFYD